MSTLSLCMIVKDEETVLPRCLESVQGLFDEIVVIDTGSTDQTREIARSFGAEVFDFQWRDDFSVARNFSFSKATGDYLFWMDATMGKRRTAFPARRLLFRAGALLSPPLQGSRRTP